MIVFGSATNPRMMFTRVIDSVEVSREEKMLISGTDSESYITEYALVYDGKLE